PASLLKRLFDCKTALAEPLATAGTARKLTGSSATIRAGAAASRHTTGRAGTAGPAPAPRLRIRAAARDPTPGAQRKESAPGRANRTPPAPFRSVPSSPPPRGGG